MIEAVKHYSDDLKGALPDDWSVAPLEMLTSIYDGTHSTPKYVPTGVPFYSVEHVSKNDFSSTKYISEEVFEKECKRVILEKGDILMTRIGDVGTARLIDWDVRASFYVSLALVKRTPLAHSKFLELAMNGTHFQKELYKRMIHVAFPVKINLGEIGKCTILLPPLPEQRKIAEILSTWDEAIELTYKLIDQLKLRKKGLMQQLLTGKKRLPGFEGEWEEHSYGSLFKEVSRPVEWDDEELYHLISVRRRSGGLFHRESLYGKQILTKTLKTARTGDFLISKMQIVHGASGLVTPEFDDMKVSGSYICLTAKEPKILDINFMNRLSQLPWFYHQTYVASYGVHIEKMTFNLKSFLKLTCLIPKFEEQKAICRILDEVDKEIVLQQDYLAQLELQKKGLMQQLLTGKTRVPLTEAS